LKIIYIAKSLTFITISKAKYKISAIPILKVTTVNLKKYILAP